MFSSRVVSVSTEIVEALGETVEDLFDQDFRGRGAGGDRERATPSSCAPIDRLDARARAARTAQPSRSATSRRRCEFEELARADDDHRVDLPRGHLHRLLPVGGGVADVLARAAPAIVGNAAFSAAITSRVSSTESVVCVTKASSLPSASASVSTSSTRSDQRDRACGQLADRADDLGMAGVADEDDVPAALEMGLRLAMHFGDQRAGRVDGG